MVVDYTSGKLDIYDFNRLALTKLGQGHSAVPAGYSDGILGSADAAVLSAMAEACVAKLTSSERERLAKELGLAPPSS